VISGTVVWFDPERDVGAIAVEGSDRDVAVRSSAIDGGGNQSLRPNDRVRLTLDDRLGGARAARVWTP